VALDYKPARTLAALRYDGPASGLGGGSGCLSLPANPRARRHSLLVSIGDSPSGGGFATIQSGAGRASADFLTSLQHLVCIVPAGRSVTLQTDDALAVIAHDLPQNRIQVTELLYAD